MIRISVSREPQTKPVFAPKHNLITLRIVEVNDRILRLKPTRSDLYQRIGLACLIALVAGPLYTLGRYGRTRADEFGNDMLIAAIGLEIIGMLGGLYILGMLLRWFLIRFALYLDGQGNLVTYARGWTTQKSELPLNELSAIQYDVVREAIRTTPAHLTSRGKALYVWVHVLTLVFQCHEEGNEPRYVRFLLACQVTPPQPNDPLPERVMTIGTWLSRVTGKQIVRGETAE